jgi:hypothetical protein
MSPAEQKEKRMLIDSCGRLAAALVFCLALLGAHGAAQAGPVMDSSATVCRPLGDNAQGGLSMTSVGLYVTAATGMAVICPITRSAQPSGAWNAGMNVWIGYQIPPQTQIGCTLYSVGYDGSLLGTATRTAPGDGTPDLINVYVPKAQMTFYSSANLYCTLPHGAWLFHVEPEIS